MYENQRGVTMWGKSVYSSNTLLPSDPTPFTLPRALPASEVADDGPGGSGTPMGAPPRSKAKGRARKYRESINTEYTLESYQTPSPAWAWLTPWMVNMRTQTDEQGWEYNLWFHKRSWRAHPGHFNWWGWVRRREWVRLRALVPEVIEKSNEETREAARDFWGPRHRHHGESGSGVASRNESARNSRFEGSTPNVSTQVLADSPDSPDTPEDPVVAAIRQRRSSEIAREVRPETTMGWGMGDVAEEAAVRHIHQGKGSGDGDNPERDHPHDHEHEDHEQAYDSDDSPASDATSITTTGSCSTAAGFISLPALLRTRTPVPDMVRALALVPLDREKLDTLVSWIEGADEGDIARLQRLLQDPADVSRLLASSCLKSYVLRLWHKC
jgi:hypothetical protein